MTFGKSVITTGFSLCKAYAKGPLELASPCARLMLMVHYNWLLLGHGLC